MFLHLFACVFVCLLCSMLAGLCVEDYSKQLVNFCVGIRKNFGGDLNLDHDIGIFFT